MRIGIDLGGTKIEAAVLDHDGQIVTRQRVPTPREGYHATLKAIGQLVSQVEETVQRRCSVGVGMPGAISPSRGVVKNANSTALIGHPFDKDLEDLLQRPVRCANDANCFALSEAADGAGAGAKTVFGAIIGTGVGGGLIIDRQVLVGCNAIAGEWGHNPLPWPKDDERPGPDCYCGQKGCIETFLSGPALSQQWREISGKEGGPADIAALAEEGNQDAEALLGLYEDRLARAFAHLINIFDPEVVVIGGGLSNLDRLYRNLPPLLEPYVFSDEYWQKFKKPIHGDSSGVRGAAWLWGPEEQ